MVPQFLGFVVFLLAGLAETRRIPFDLVEAESELVAGFHTEYSGMKFGMFFVGEYLGITLVSALIVTLFFGGWLGPVAARLVWFLIKTLHLHLLLHPGARHVPAAALRPAHGARLEDPAAALAGQPARDRRHRAGAGRRRMNAQRRIRRSRRGATGASRDAVSTCRASTAVAPLHGIGCLAHPFRRSDTIQYPEEMLYLPPRYRGRIVLSRDPDGGERCVACYLCAVACPVDCIALQATEDENGRRYPAWFRINFSRCIYCGFCEEACPTYAIQLTPDAR